MSRYQIKPLDDRLGPYRWRNVCLSKDGRLVLCEYREPDPLTPEQAEELRRICDATMHEVREAEMPTLFIPSLPESAGTPP